MCWKPGVADQVLTATHSETMKRILLREYIGRCLYRCATGLENDVVQSAASAAGSVREAPRGGKEQQEAFFERPVIHCSRPLDFNNMLGASEYRYRLSDLYRMTNEQFLTPAEIFKPWYGRAIANFILSRLPPSVEATRRVPRRGGHNREPAADQRLRIVEIGGGTGTCAVDVLDRLREYSHDLYRRTSYTIVEISGSLASLQRERLRRAGHIVDDTSVLQHGCDVQVLQGSALDGDEGSGRQGIEYCEHPCFVIALEVLDNLPHDAVRVGPEGLEEAVMTVDDVDTGSNMDKMQQRRKASGGGEARKGGHGDVMVPKLSWRPLGDALIRTALQLSAHCTAGGGTVANGQTMPGRKDFETFREVLRSTLATTRSPTRVGLIRHAVGLAAGTEGNGVGEYLEPGHLRKVTDADLDAMGHNCTGLGGEGGVSSFSGALFVPTGACRLVSLLHRRRPRHTLLAADFTSLPGAMHGAGGPVVQGKGVGDTHTTDYATLEHVDVARGMADIFFPTDFDGFLRMHSRSGQQHQKTQKTDTFEDGTSERRLSGGQEARETNNAMPHGAFLRRYGEHQKTRTIFGFNPMLDDYANMAFVVAEAARAGEMQKTGGFERTP